MNSDILIKDYLVKYILFQRSALIKYSRGKVLSVLNKLSPIPFYEKSIAWEASLRKEIIKQQYQKTDNCHNSRPTPSPADGNPLVKKSTINKP